MALSLNAPIEDLRLSNRVCNVLHLSGLHTVASLLNCNYKTALRGFGPGARAELASALESNGFSPPANLNPSEIDGIAADIAKLFGQMEASFQKWSSRIEHFEMRIKELTARGSRHQRYRPAADVEEQVNAVSGFAPAQEFRTRLRDIRTASAALREATDLPVERQDIVTLVEEESVRLSLLVCRLVEMLPVDGARKPFPPPEIRSGESRPHA